MSNRVLVLGGGGREHCLAVQLAKSPLVELVHVWPGNAGCAGGKLRRVPADCKDPVAKVAKDLGVALVVVGPEGPLVEGVADALKLANVPCFGPTKMAAQLEWSKAYSKDFFSRHGLPTARYSTFSDFDAACAHVRAVDYPVVLKASGLAAGKGVLIPPKRDVKEAIEGLRKIMVERAFGEAGDQVVIEEMLEGEEVSVLAFCDGKTSVCMPGAQDHKRALDGDQGPNTGGMGAYAPAPCLTPALQCEVKRIVQRTMDGLASEGTPFVGCLFAGLMLTANGPMLLEYNCRMGDPETQVVLPLLESDLFQICLACAQGRLREVEVKWSSNMHAATVVVASKGYPDKYPKGMRIMGLEKAAQTGAIVFHAGTVTEMQAVVANGGRVLAVTGLGATLREAVDKAYAGVQCISFDPQSSMQYRTDIGHRALNLQPTVKRMRSGGDEITTLQAAHVSQTANVLYVAFSTDKHSWGRAVGRDPSGMYGWMLNDYVPARVAEGMSLVATTRDDAVVVGTLCIERFSKEHASRGDEDKGMRAIQAMLAACDDVFVKRNTADEYAAYFAFVAVDPAHRRRHIADQLVRAGVDLSRSLGYRLCCAFCVSPASAAVFAHNGFELWGTVPYATFQVEGGTPFASLAPDACTVMVRRL